MISEFLWPQGRRDQRRHPAAGGERRRGNGRRQHSDRFCCGCGGIRAAGSLLFGIEANDPVTYIAAAAVLLVVVLLSTAVPAWRASRVDPMIALRNE
jgi:hypothetical protein